MIDASRLLGFLDVMDGINPAWAILHPRDAEGAHNAKAETLQSVRAYVSVLVEPERTLLIERGES